MKNQNPSNLSAYIFSALKERIIRWEYPPGHRFTEESLCDEFNVSRSPVREALGILVENGLVDKEPYRGYSVKQPNFAEIDELYDVRLALESFAVQRLAEVGMPEDIWERLNDIWQAILEGLPDINEDIAEKDEAFHETLAMATGNHVLVQILRNINERLHFIRMTDITTPERLYSTCEQHLRVLECIRSGQVDCARGAILMNIESGKNNVESAVKEALARAYLSKSPKAF